MGVVYEAYDRLTGSRVALKRVPLETVWSTMMTARGTQIGKAADSTHLRGMRAALASEFHTLAALRHPNIISVLDYGFDNQQTPFFTMELLPSPQTLVAAGAGLALEDQVELIVQLLRALAYLHRHLIVHRDLKPSNVLVTKKGTALEVKVLDFGIATTRGSAVELAGTLEYMAPEVLFGQAPTESADLYAVGVMMYQMLTGSHPHIPPGATSGSASQERNTESNPTMPPQLADFLSNRPLEVVTAERRAALESQESRQTGTGAVGAVTELSGPLGAVVQRLLARDPNERYRDVGQVLADLGAAIGRPLQLDTAATRESFLAASVLVGRERELRQLTEALEQARRGRGGAILLTGESGVGKSRLLDEVRSSALVRGVRVLRGQCVSTAGGSYEVLLDVLRALVLDTPLQELEASVLKGLLADLPALLGRSIGDAPSLGAQATRQRLRRVLLDVLTRPTEPILLLLEDIQWAAPDSIELLKELLPRTANQPLLLIASAREDEQPNITRALPGAALLRLARLDQHAIATLSESMLGEAGTHPDLLALLTRETEGNSELDYDAAHEDTYISCGQGTGSSWIHTCKYT